MVYLAIGLNSGFWFDINLFRLYRKIPRKQWIYFIGIDL